MPGVDRVECVGLGLLVDYLNDLAIRQGQDRKYLPIVELTRAA